MGFFAHPQPLDHIDRAAIERIQPCKNPLKAELDKTKLDYGACSFGGIAFAAGCWTEDIAHLCLQSIRACDFQQNLSQQYPILPPHNRQARNIAILINRS